MRFSVFGLVIFVPLTLVFILGLSTSILAEDFKIGDKVTMAFGSYQPLMTVRGIEPNKGLRKEDGTRENLVNVVFFHFFGSKYVSPKRDRRVLDSVEYKFMGVSESDLRKLKKVGDRYE